MNELTIIAIDDRGRFHRNVEMLYLPQPHNGEARCILRATDGYQKPFKTAEDLRAVVLHARSLPGATFDAELVVEFGLDTPLEGGPDPTAYKLPNQSRSAAFTDWGPNFDAA